MQPLAPRPGRQIYGKRSRIIPAARFPPPRLRGGAGGGGGGWKRRGEETTEGKCQICISGKRERGGVPRTAPKSRYASSIATIASFRRVSFFTVQFPTRGHRIRHVPPHNRRPENEPRLGDETRAESSLPRSRYRNYLAIGEKKSPLLPAPRSPRPPAPFC